jgi:hypothetical protein
MKPRAFNSSSALGSSLNNFDLCSNGAQQDQRNRLTSNINSEESSSDSNPSASCHDWSIHIQNSSAPIFPMNLSLTQRPRRYRKAIVGCSLRCCRISYYRECLIQGARTEDFGVFWAISELLSISPPVCGSLDPDQMFKAVRTCQRILVEVLKHHYTGPRTLSVTLSDLGTCSWPNLLL